MDFEFGIIGDQLDLTDDEDLLSYVAEQALKLGLRKESSFTAWKGETPTQFQKFLADLFGELQPRKNDYLARLNIVTRLSSALAYMDSFRGARLSTFGSFESQLYTRWADLDLSLELPSRGGLSGCVSKQVKVTVLKSLLRTLLRQGEARNLQFIPYARVPLITFEDSLHNISCDISVENDVAIMKSRFLRWIADIDSRCRDLVFLVKCWAKAHDINDPKKGTLNSYALCLLVIFHLQTRSPPVLPALDTVLEEAMANRIKGAGLENSREEAMRVCWKKIQPYVSQKFGAQNRSSVAELFISFFNQFSSVEKLWDQGLAVCTLTGAWGDRSTRSAKWRSKFYSIAIEDPFDRDENCARSVRQTTSRYIFKAFSASADSLSHPIPDGGLSRLLEALFLWPVGEQSMGLQAWLSKVYSKEGRSRTVLIGRNFMERSMWVASGQRGKHGISEGAKQYPNHHHNTKQLAVSNYIAEAQHMQRINLTDAGTPVVSGRTRRKLRYRAMKKEAASVAAAAREPDAQISHVGKIVPGNTQALDIARESPVGTLAHEAKVKEMVVAHKQVNRLVKAEQRHLPIRASADRRDEVKVKKPSWVSTGPVSKEENSWAASLNEGVGLYMQNFPALQRVDRKQNYKAGKGYQPPAEAGSDSTKSSSGIQSHMIVNVPTVFVCAGGSPEEKPSSEEFSRSKQPLVTKHKDNRSGYEAGGSTRLTDYAYSTQSSSGIQSHMVVDVPTVFVCAGGSPGDKPSTEEVSTSKQSLVTKPKDSQRNSYKARGSTSVNDDDAFSTQSSSGIQLHTVVDRPTVFVCAGGSPGDKPSIEEVSTSKQSLVTKQNDSRRNRLKARGSMSVNDDDAFSTQSSSGIKSHMVVDVPTVFVCAGGSLEEKPSSEEVSMSKQSLVTKHKGSQSRYEAGGSAGVTDDTYSTQSSSGFQSHMVVDVPTVFVCAGGSPGGKPSTEEVSTSKQSLVTKQKDSQRSRYKGRGSRCVNDDAFSTQSSSGIQSHMVVDVPTVFVCAGRVSNRRSQNIRTVEETGIKYEVPRALISSSGDVGIASQNVRMDMSEVGTQPQGESLSK